MTAGRSPTGMTLLEVVLAVTLTVALMGSVFWFYDQALGTRSALVRQVEILASECAIMDGLTRDLGCAKWDSLVGADGQGDRFEFPAAFLPSPAAWVEPEPGQPLPPPVHDLRRVGYGLRTWTDELGEEHIDGVERTVLRSPTLREIDEATDVERVLLSEDFKFLSLRYWDGGTWLTSWGGGGLPGAVEVVLGLQPLPPRTEPVDYPYETFRREIYVPAARVASATSAPAEGGP